MFGFGWLKRRKKIKADIVLPEDMVVKLNKFLIDHSGHNTNIIRDMVIINCNQCGVSFIVPVSAWESIVTQLKNAGPDAKTVDVPVTRN